MLLKRNEFCGLVSLAEELVTVGSYRDFLRKNEVYAQLALVHPEAEVRKDSVAWILVEAYRKTFNVASLHATASQCILYKFTPAQKAETVAQESGYIVWPRSSATACLVAAYAILKCEQLFSRQCWLYCVLTPVQRIFQLKYPKVDFDFSVMYGSWSRCPHCGIMFFNDKYFSSVVYQDRQTFGLDLLAAVRRIVPTDPCEHSYGQVGVSSRWWYLHGMYKPEMQCKCCTKPELIPVSGTKKEKVEAGKMFSSMLRKKREEKYEAARAKSASGGHGQDVMKTGELYRSPCLDIMDQKTAAAECVSWPVYRQGNFHDFGTGDRMLELTLEARALQNVVLRSKVKAEKYGYGHQLNWKKIGLNTAYFNKKCRRGGVYANTSSCSRLAVSQGEQQALCALPGSTGKAYCRCCLHEYFII